MENYYPKFDESTRYVPTRTTLWCPVCHAQANLSCKPVGGLRFSSHDAYATGRVERTPTRSEMFEVTQARKDAPNAPRLRQWVN
jgi:hypothetical protein